MQSFQASTYAATYPTYQATAGIPSSERRTAAPCEKRHTPDGAHQSRVTVWPSGAWLEQGPLFEGRGQCLRGAAGEAAYGQWVQKNQPTQMGFVFSCRCSIKMTGKAPVSRVSIGKTRRGLDMLTAMAELSIEAQYNAVKDQFHPMRGLFIGVGYDATPMLVEFGKLASAVCNFGKYLVRREDRPCWRTVTFQVFKELRGHIPPKFGVLAIFGATVALVGTWGSCVGRECIVQPPRVLKQAHGSTIFAAIHRRCEAISMASLSELGRTGPFALQECPYACKVNLRNIAYTRTVLPPTCLYDSAHLCCTHLPLDHCPFISW